MSHDRDEEREMPTFRNSDQRPYERMDAKLFHGAIQEMQAAVQAAPANSQQRRLLSAVVFFLVDEWQQAEVDVLDGMQPAVNPLAANIARAWLGLSDEIPSA